MRAGSIPPTSTEILQEGIVIPPVRLVRAGELERDLLDLVLANVRTPGMRRGDLRAQLAAAAVAQERLEALVARRGGDVVRDAMASLVAYAERRSRAAVAELPDGVYRAEDVLEGDGITSDDIPIRVAVEIRGEELRVDFAGTAPATRGNVNCAIGVTRSACCFALRVVLPADIPTNAGLYAPLAVEAPVGCLVHAQRPSAVVAGNTETSQRIADTVLAALAQAVELPAQGQGTMNNLVLGGEGWTYYETIGGGQGGGPRGPGDSGVHVGMSNALNTPVEALELELPLRVRRYELVPGSGGAGRHPGGDGIVREVEALAPAALSLVTERRRRAPRGPPAEPTAPGARTASTASRSAAKVAVDLAPGDVVTVRTPGGGGWGAP